MFDYVISNAITTFKLINFIAFFFTQTPITSLPFYKVSTKEIRLYARFRVKKLDNFCVTLLHVTHNRVKSMQKHVLLKLQTSALDLEFGFGSD